MELTEDEEQVRRVLYAPTASRQAAFKTWLASPEKYPRNLRTALLARIDLALRRDPALAVRLIDVQKEQLTNWLAGNPILKTRMTSWR